SRPAGDDPQALHARVAGRDQILHADPVRPPDAHGAPEIDAIDDLAADVAGADPAARALAGHEVRAARRVDHDPFVEDRAQAEQYLSNDPAVAVTLCLVADGAGGIAYDDVQYGAPPGCEAWVVS